MWLQFFRSAEGCPKGLTCCYSDVFFLQDLQCVRGSLPRSFACDPGVLFDGKWCNEGPVLRVPEDALNIFKLPPIFGQLPFDRGSFVAISFRVARNHSNKRLVVSCYILHIGAWDTRGCLAPIASILLCWSFQLGSLNHLAVLWLGFLDKAIPTWALSPESPVDYSFHQVILEDW